jgi:hypothetical protein
MTPVHLLTIDRGKTPIKVEKYELSLPPEQLKPHLLNLLNEGGASCSILAKCNGQLWTIVHTAPRGNSKVYHKEQINYHPLAGQLT